MNKIGITGLFGLIILVVLISGCTSNVDPGLILLNSSLESSDFNSPVVTGYVKNNGSSTIHVVQVDVKFFDKNGVQIADGIAATTDLAPGVTWKFEAYPSAVLTKDEIGNYTVSLSYSD